MESTGAPSRIQISEDTAVILQTHFTGQFQVTERGVISVKGKADLRTFWLDGENHAGDEI